MSDLVLVTGGSGYVASRCILELVERGYAVRATVRGQSGQESVLAAVGRDHAALSFAEADLTADGGWDAAVDGCTSVLHVASPFPNNIQAMHTTDLLTAAREGTRRVLAAAQAAGVKRVVVTSSQSAIVHGHPKGDHVYTESDWTELSGNAINPYVESKTLAERAAWDFVREQAPDLELVAINPAPILGPLLTDRIPASAGVVKGMLDGMPAVPNLCMSIADIRDVADLHIRAMESPKAAGERFIAVSGDPWWHRDIAKLLRDELGERASRVPTRTIPNWQVRALAKINPPLREVASHLDVVHRLSNEKARTVLGWNPRPVAESILATAESLLSRNLTAAAN